MWHIGRISCSALLADFNGIIAKCLNLLLIQIPHGLSLGQQNGVWLPIAQLSVEVTPFVHIKPLNIQNHDEVFRQRVALPFPQIPRFYQINEGRSGLMGMGQIPCQPSSRASQIKVTKGKITRFFYNAGEDTEVPLHIFDEEPNGHQTRQRILRNR